MHDGIKLEQNGLPTGVIITEPFVGASRAIAARDGLPDYRFVTLPHPTAALKGEAVRDAAIRIVFQLEAILLGLDPSPGGGDP